MLLMNGNRPVLQYQIDDLFIKVIDNDYLPYALNIYSFNGKSAGGKIIDHILEILHL